MKMMKKMLVAVCLSLVMILGMPIIMPVSVQTMPVEAATKIKLNKKKATIYVGKSVQLKIKGTKAKVKWTSNKKSVAKVNSKGKVTAKKAGKAVITAKVEKKKYKCTVTVKKKDNSSKPQIVDVQSIQKIKYISDRSVEYDSEKLLYRVFFSLKLEDGSTRVSSSGTAKIKIVNDAGKELYNQDREFSEKDFKYWINPSNGIKYMCCIEISVSDIERGKVSKGKLSFEVTLPNIGEFPVGEYSIDNLPEFDPNELCVINLPDTPIEIADISSYTLKVNSKCVISNVISSVEKKYSGGFNATISLEGTKTYDKSSENQSSACRIGWKLYKDDIVVESGVEYTAAVSVNEKFSGCKISIFNLEEGNYKLVLMDVN